jgi:hypothetical protein
VARETLGRAEAVGLADVFRKIAWGNVHKRLRIQENA